AVSLAILVLQSALIAAGRVETAESVIGAIRIALLVIVAGCSAAAARTFERGDYLRGPWRLLALEHVVLIIEEGAPQRGLLLLRKITLTVGNLAGIFAFYGFARMLGAAGLGYGPRWVRLLSHVVAVGIALGLVLPTLLAHLARFGPGELPIGDV